MVLSGLGIFLYSNEKLCVCNVLLFQMYDVDGVVVFIVVFVILVTSITPKIPSVYLTGVLHIGYNVKQQEHNKQRE